METVENPTGKFATNVGLITSSGPHGDNVMAAEWTHHVSYNPNLIAVHIGPHKATWENIKKTKQFGVNLASVEQNVVASAAGGSHGQNVDKIAVLKDLGVDFYNGKKIDVLMIRGAALNAECKVVKQIELGDHMMFVGEVVEISATENEPLLYHGKKYWKIGENLPKPPAAAEKVKKLVEKYARV